jgi:hypothetical protein
MTVPRHELKALNITNSDTQIEMPNQNYDTHKNTLF